MSKIKGVHSARYFSWFLLTCLWLFSGVGVAHASGGGTCPTGSNYIDLSNPSNGGGNGSITLSTMGVTNCFYVSSAGLDTNTGTSEGSPWLHAPGMPSCSSNCAAATIDSGTGVILRGGDTWHKSSGSPGLGGVYSFSTSGSSLSSPIYFGFDLTWFSGGSFARPVFSEDNPLSTGLPASCSFNDDGTTFFSNGSSSNVIVDGIEFTGDCASSGGSGSLLHPGNADVYERIYIHGWTFATSATGDNRFRVGGNGTDGSRYLFFVIDGADSTNGATCTTTACIQGPLNCTYANDQYVCNGGAGWGWEDCFDVEYSITRHVSNAAECVAISIWHDDLTEFAFEPSIGSQHGNMLETLTPGNTCVNFFFYNNVFRNYNEGVGIWPECGTNSNSNSASFVFFNNVIENDGHHPPDPNGVMGSPSCTNLSTCTNTGVVTWYYFNNTTDSTVAGRAGPTNSTTPAWTTGSVATFENNHLIGQTTLSGFWSLGAGNSGTVTDNGGEKFQTTSSATTQNYLLTNDFSPGNGGGNYATVGFANNATTSFCNTLSSIASAPPGIVAACKGGTSKGVLEVSKWGGEFSSYPAITVNARPSAGAWDAGAYEFVAAPPPAPAPAGWIFARKDNNDEKHSEESSSDRGSRLSGNRR